MLPIAYFVRRAESIYYLRRHTDPGVPSSGQAADREGSAVASSRPQRSVGKLAIDMCRRKAKMCTVEVARVRPIGKTKLNRRGIRTDHGMITRWVRVPSHAQSLSLSPQEVTLGNVAQFVNFTRAKMGLDLAGPLTNSNCVPRATQLAVVV